MRIALRILGNLLGAMLAIAGLLGVSAKVPLPAVLAWLHNPIVAIAAMFLAVVVFSFTWADFIAEHQIASAGGHSKKEFPARFDRWDPIDFLEVWHIAYLWAGLEPLDRETQKTRAYPEFRRLKQDLNAGLIPDIQKQGSTWMDALVPRQKLIDYAVLRRERPKFLFPYMRSVRTRLQHRLFGSTEIDPAEIPKYKSSMSWMMDIYVYCGDAPRGIGPAIHSGWPKDGPLQPRRNRKLDQQKHAPLHQRHGLYCPDRGMTPPKENPGQPLRTAPGLILSTCEAERHSYDENTD